MMRYWAIGDGILYTVSPLHASKNAIHWSSFMEEVDENLAQRLLEVQALSLLQALTWKK